MSSIGRSGPARAHLCILKLSAALLQKTFGTSIHCLVWEKVGMSLIFRMLYSLAGPEGPDMLPAKAGTLTRSLAPVQPRQSPAFRRKPTRGFSPVYRPSPIVPGPEGPRLLPAKAGTPTQRPFPFQPRRSTAFRRKSSRGFSPGYQARPPIPGPEGPCLLTAKGSVYLFPAPANREIRKAGRKTFFFCHS